MYFPLKDEKKMNYETRTKEKKTSGFPGQEGF